MYIYNLLEPEEKKKSALTNLLTRKMTRREFLVYGGMVMITISGIAGILKAVISPDSLPFSKKYPKQILGYGSSSYGGVEKKG